VKTFRFIPLLLLFAFASTHAIFAQAKMPGETVPPSASAETTVVLNPFVVNTEKDTGYAASSTLAGTRLNTPIADLGASISILTKDFLDDIAPPAATSRTLPSKATTRATSLRPSRAPAASARPISRAASSRPTSPPTPIRSTASRSTAVPTPCSSALAMPAA
jgi:hypothetical protein